MDRNDAREGQRVRVKSEAKEHYADQEGVILQIWPHPAYKWYDWALVDFPEVDDNCDYILFEDLDPVEEKQP